MHFILCEFKDSLREEEREVNHHDRVREFDADGNEITNENKSEVKTHTIFRLICDVSRMPLRPTLSQ